MSNRDFGLLTLYFILLGVCGSAYKNERMLHPLFIGICLILLIIITVTKPRK